MTQHETDRPTDRPTDGRDRFSLFAWVAHFSLEKTLQFLRRRRQNERASERACVRVVIVLFGSRPREGGRRPRLKKLRKEGGRERRHHRDVSKRGERESERAKEQPGSASGRPSVSPSASIAKPPSFLPSFLPSPFFPAGRRMVAKMRSGPLCVCRLGDGRGRPAAVSIHPTCRRRVSREEEGVRRNEMRACMTCLDAKGDVTGHFNAHFDFL